MPAPDTGALVSTVQKGLDELLAAFRAKDDPDRETKVQKLAHDLQEAVNALSTADTIAHPGGTPPEKPATAQNPRH